MKEKILLILGASSDLGIKFIESEIKKYDYIIAHYNKNINPLLKLQKRFPEKMSLKRADFNNIQDLQKFTEEIKNEKIPTHIIHFPAIKCCLKRFDKFDMKRFEENMQISVFSIALILQNILPVMVKQHYGKIVFVLSIYTITDMQKYISDYIIAKFALLGLMKSLSAEYKDKGIRINGVSPDLIETKFLSELPHIVVDNIKSENSSKGILSISDVIPVIAYLLDEVSDSIYGQNIGIY